jgi:hypothetical protein
MEEFDEWNADDLRIMDRQRARKFRKARTERRELERARKEARSS